MPEPPDFDQIVATVLREYTIRDESHDVARRLATELRLVWNARGQADRERIGEIIGEQREPDYSLRMAQESIKTLDR
jgi:hypothetical protein